MSTLLFPTRLSIGQSFHLQPNHYKLMHPNIIRICERSDALLMLQDGSFKSYLQMWSDRFPQKGNLQTVKAIKESVGCSLKEAVDIVNPKQGNEEVWFEVGDTVLFRKRNNYLEWYLKIEDTWVYKGKVNAICLCEKDLFPKKPEVTVICTDRRIRRSIDSEALANQILYRHRIFRGCYYRVGDEIWTLDDQDQIVISSGSGPGTITQETIRNSPWMVRDHIDQYKKAHKRKYGL